MTMAEKYELKRAINSLARELGRFPSKEELCKAFSVKEKKLNELLHELLVDNFIYRNGDWYDFDEQEDELIILGEPDQIPQNILTNNATRSRTMGQDIIESLEEAVEYEEERSLSASNKKRGRPPGSKNKRIIEDTKILEQEPIKKEDDSIVIKSIRIIMGIIGIGAATISIYYTAIWLIEFLPFLFAILLSTIMVGFSISTFEVIVLIFSGSILHSKLAKWTVCALFSVLWVIVSTFSIISTVAGQYNKYVSGLQEQTRSGVSTGRANWGIIQERKQELQLRLSEYRQQVLSLNKIMSGLSNVEKRQENSGIWGETQYRLSKANKEMNKISDELEKVRAEERKQIDESRRHGVSLTINGGDGLPDFYGWFAKVVNVHKDRAQFLMSLFPAIFVDIISPIGIAIALFLRKRI